MKVYIDHDQCQHAGAYADRCLAATILNPLSHEHYCSFKTEDDGKPELTVVLTFDGREHTLVLRTQAEREAVAAEGWAAFVRPEAA